MDVYGLTGGIGSGKSTVAELLESYGVPVVSADELSRIVVARGSEGLADVVQRFGPGVLDEQRDLDRRKMAALVFQDPNKRRELEAILHPRIRERFEQVLDALEKAGHEVAIYEVPLLFEKNLQGEMKAVILVTADDAIRTARVRARDDVTETEVRARMAAQMSEAAKRRRADYVIENNGSIDDLRREVEFLLARFLRLATDAEPLETEPSQQETIIPTGQPVAPPNPPATATLPPLSGGTLPPTELDTTSMPPVPRKGGTLPPDPAAPPPSFPTPPVAPPLPALQHTQRMPAVSPQPRQHPGELHPTIPDPEPEPDDG
jgi:dephospho-CoA kinase